MVPLVQYPSGQTLQRWLLPCNVFFSSKTQRAWYCKNVNLTNSETLLLTNKTLDRIWLYNVQVPSLGTTDKSPNSFQKYSTLLQLSKFRAGETSKLER